MIQFDFKKDCCGCGACIASCPVNAISWTNTDEGFHIPTVDEDICINCGKCDRNCPVLSDKEKALSASEIDVWMAANKSKEALSKSASGGVFYGIANNILQNNGVVAGVVWNESMQAVYSVSNQQSELERMRGSKYVQALPKNCINEVSEYLKQGKKVLFSGTPCQIAGLIKCVGHPENLITCGIICEGVASPLVWKVYKECLENKFGSQLINAEMRSKCDGWSGGSSRYTFANEKQYIQKRCFSLDPYIAGFIEGLFNRPCCRECKFKGVSENCDFLIGDFWGFTKEQKEKNENRGMSTVISCTSKGKALWNELFEDFLCEQVSYELVCKSNNIEHSGHWAKNREEFLEKIEKQSSREFEKIVWTCSGKMLKKKLMKILQNIGILDIM